MKRKKRKLVLLLLAGFLIGFVWLGLDTKIRLREYTVESEKLTGPVRVAFLSDLHSCDYSEEWEGLLAALGHYEPDLVLLGGDWVDDDFGNLPPERAYTAARTLAERWPTFYVTGNHEFWSGQVQKIKEELTDCGVTVLAGETVTVEVRGQKLDLCGVDDPAAGEEIWAGQLAAVRAAKAGERFSLLLTHRPERWEDYGGFDLALAGHAHGGQWRIPGLLNGVVAPDQGLFPRYAGGLYPLEGGGTLVVGRGLARESTRIPRLWNPTELVMVELVPPS